MFGSAILDVAAGIVLIYVVLSMLCSALKEGIEGWLKTRAAYLDRGIREILSDINGNDLTAALYKHPLINSLFFGDYSKTQVAEKPHFFSRGHGLPSYIPSRNFALALLDVVARGPSDINIPPASPSPLPSLQDLRTRVSHMANPCVRDALTVAIDTAGNDFAVAVRNVEAWYDSVMDRVSGKYKRASQSILLILGFAVAAGFNINTLAIADYLYANPPQRAAIFAQAEATAKEGAEGLATIDKLNDTVAAMKLPIGWSACARPANCSDASPETLWEGYLAPLLGWMLTAFAISLGAPFWFDVLNKVMMLRSTLKPREANAAPVPIMPVPASTAGAGVDDGTIDGCDTACVDPTRDDQLPPAQGGVA
jgi:hypothetical protein